MIVRVGLEGSVTLAEPDDQARLELEIVGSPASLERARNALSGIARLTSPEQAVVGTGWLRTRIEAAGGTLPSGPAWEADELPCRVDWVPAARRNRPVHGVSLGILMLDTGFERLPGDVGHAGTWPFPVQYAVVRGATSRRVVARTIDADVLDLFVAAALDLVRLGVDGITTSCGFLALLHPQLKARLPVPVATSSLLQIPMIMQILPAGQRVGVLTMSEAALTPAHFAAVGAPADLPVAGIPQDSAFRQSQLLNRREVSGADNEAAMIAAGRRLIAENPDVGAIVLECTNMPSYAGRLAAALGLPVYDIFTLVQWFHAGLRPTRFAEPAR